MNRTLPVVVDMDRLQMMREVGKLKYYIENCKDDEAIQLMLSLMLSIRGEQKNRKETP